MSTTARRAVPACRIPTHGHGRTAAMTSVANDLALALEMADAADALTLDRFGALDLRVDTKPDLTPVTDADRSAEELLRASLSAPRARRFGVRRRTRRHTGFHGPAMGARPDRRHQELRPRRPVWCTLIALLVDGTPVVGVVSAPALGRRWWAATARAPSRRSPVQHGPSRSRSGRPRFGEPVVLGPHHGLG